MTDLQQLIDAVDSIEIHSTRGGANIKELVNLHDAEIDTTALQNALNIGRVYVLLVQHRPGDAWFVVWDADLSTAVQNALETLGEA